MKACFTTKTEERHERENEAKECSFINIRVTEEKLISAHKHPLLTRGTKDVVIYATVGAIISFASVASHIALKLQSMKVTLKVWGLFRASETLLF
ncbi:hypothetical protein CDAR_378341 [Caerostris darwini]|uniref:Uncharacterized protein n=1 Tax=Caerostris darwini TaxID=1538125 RepID=A0AAV4T827_9ARAC|nr:hypothetical protein CDAR_378341 [Caerostris darwini]